MRESFAVTHEMTNMFSPARIGALDLKNRVVMLPMGTRCADAEGFVTDRMLDYYEERAKGGVGLIVVEISCVDAPVGKLFPNMLVIDHDKYIPGLSRLAHVIKKHGARAAIQIAHAGNATRSELTGAQPVAPSPVKRRGLHDAPRELTVQEIQALVRRFADGAERARRAGFDGVEIHGAHSYLVAQFLSAAWNKRHDEYGGSLANRTRFLAEVIGAIRQRIGSEFPLWCRLNGEEEGEDGGTTLEEARATAQALQGTVDAISVSATASGAAMFMKCSPLVPGALLPLARSIKQAVRIPVIGAGRLDFAAGTAALRDHSIDLVGVGRAFICQPDFPAKWAAGRPEDVRPCITCYNCFSELDPLTCSVNPLAGRERELLTSPAPQPKKIVVVGGGPAGMQSACVASSMGHHVVLFERRAWLGGQLPVALVPPEKKQHLEQLTRYLISQVHKLAIEVRLGVEADKALIQRERPDLVVVATGIVPFFPDIPGVAGDNVVHALDVLDGARETGAKVVVIGGDLVGCETADFLAERGRAVVITRRGPTMAAHMHPALRRSLMNRLKAHGVRMLANVRYEEITNHGLVISTESGRQLIAADTIVIAAGQKPNAKLHLSLKEEMGREAVVVAAGDCLRPAGIKEALEHGTRAVALAC